MTAPPHPRIGALLSLASAALAAIFLIPYKLAGEHAPADLVTVTMLASAAVFNTLTSAGSKLRAARARGRAQGRGQGRTGRSLGLTLVISAVIAVFTAAGNYAVAEALTSAAPGLVSVVQQTQVVFVAAISAVLLGERITLRFGVGVAVALAGFMVMSLPVGQDAGQSAGVPLGALWALLSAVCFGSMHVITRMEAHRIDPVLVNAIRLWFAVALMLPGRLDGALGLDRVTWALVAGAAFLGPFLGRLCLMFAVRHISASRSALLVLAGPVFAFLFAWMVLRIVPAPRELLGGALILAGIALPVLELVAAAGPPVAAAPPTIATGDATPTASAAPAAPADQPADDGPVTGPR